MSSLIVAASGSVTVLLVASLILLGVNHKRVRCAVRGMHRDITRHPLGGFICGECSYVGTDYEEMGWENGGYVPHLRRVFSREHRNGNNEKVYGIENIERKAW